MVPSEWKKLKFPVRESDFSRHNESLIMGTPQYVSAVVYRGHQWGTLMPRDTSLSDSYTSDRSLFPGVDL